MLWLGLSSGLRLRTGFKLGFVFVLGLGFVLFRVRVRVSIRVMVRFIRLGRELVELGQGLGLGYCWR